MYMSITKSIYEDVGREVLIWIFAYVCDILLAWWVEIINEKEALTENSIYYFDSITINDTSMHFQCAFNCENCLFCGNASGGL